MVVLSRVRDFWDSVANCVGREQLAARGIYAKDSVEFSLELGDRGRGADGEFGESKTQNYEGD